MKHEIPPVYDEDSAILILGSFPSVRSRETGFYYGHPQNRFWRFLAMIYEEEVPGSIEEKKAFLHRHHIALWDVIASCEIEGSSDSSIRDVVPNEIGEILDISPIKRVIVNGKKAESLYRKYLEEKAGMKAVCMPSTSPANASYSLSDLVLEWRKALSQ